MLKNLNQIKTSSNSEIAYLLATAVLTPAPATATYFYLYHHQQHFEHVKSAYPVLYTRASL